MSPKVLDTPDKEVIHTFNSLLVFANFLILDVDSMIAVLPI